MSTKQVQKLWFEIAILGQNGLDINDPAQKYSLRSWPSQYSGLHLCAIMYAALQQFASGQKAGHRLLRGVRRGLGFEVGGRLVSLSNQPPLASLASQPSVYRRVSRSTP